MIRAKFKVVEVVTRELAPNYVQRGVILQPQYDNSIEEDRRFQKATPTGRFEMQVDNPAALAELTIGREFYIDLTPVGSQ